jgi:predicted ATPase
VKRFIMTGAPGAGKTSILRILQGRGYATVDEAATDVISFEQSRGSDEPWTDPLFVDRIIEAQRFRQLRPAAAGAKAQIYDRSPVCTLALAHYLGRPVTPVLADEIDRIIRDQVYQRKAFLIRPIGFSELTAARRISYEESLEFERYHEDAYLRHGFELVEIPAGEPDERAARIDACITSWA